jgi:hypothetical protein
VPYLAGANTLKTLQCLANDEWAARLEMEKAELMTTATATVRSFLSLMEQRQLDAAKALLAPGFQMTFPGEAQFSTLEALVIWGAERYASVAKHYERFDELSDSSNPTQQVVYCFGTLHGQWLDGSAFTGIRFIDRFVVADGLLVDQRVWNDLAEAKGCQLQ